MRRSLIVLAGMFAFLVTTAQPSVAITHGSPDTQHPNVGAMLVDLDFDGTGGDPALRFQLCSGSLLAPTYFLTAGHCVAFLEDFADVIVGTFVSFDADLRLDETTGAVDPGNVIAVDAYAKHPDFRCNLSTCYDDVGVLTLDSSPSGIDPIQLPTLGFLDREAAGGGLRGHVFVNVGYGVTAFDRSTFSPNVTVGYDGLRNVSTSLFSALTRYHLFLLTNSSATGLGGSCAGDSGGPKFYEPVPGSLPNLVVAVTTSGDPVCRALSQNQRLDTTSARSFLDNFVGVP